MEVWQQSLGRGFLDILERLPVQSLVRFRTVSKLWCNVIKSYNFFNSYHNKQRVKGNVLLVRRCLPPPENADVLSFHDLNCDELNEISPNLSIPFLKDLRYKYGHTYNPENVHLLGPLNGLVCLVYHDDCVIFCNPALREFKRIQPCPFTCPKGFYSNPMARGFGNTCSNDYKVVLVRSVDSDSDYDDESWVLVHLYNSGTNSWRAINVATNIPYIEHDPCSEVFFNGACHWNADSSWSIRPPDIILSFDVSTEVFAQFEYPDYFKELHESKPCLMVLNECLAIVWHREQMKEPIEVWIMKEYVVKESWTKRLVIGPYLVVRAFFYWKNDEWLLTETSPGQLASCALHTNAIKTFQIFGTEETFCALIYKESLISLNEVIKNVPKLD